ncbi:hypothetical protein GGR55DRAFT_641774 [Xylaria sp. FL0064]|nr:hypothetical protein GGR55DRAFT_641774 [Xylaria sp. FL0064]
MRISHVDLLVYPRSSFTEPIEYARYVGLSSWHLVDKSIELFRSEPLSNEYCLMEPGSYLSATLLHTYHRFKG